MLTILDSSMLRVTPAVFAKARIVAALVVFTLQAATQTGNLMAQVVDRATVMRQTLKLADDGDSYQAFEHLESQNDPRIVGESYSDLVRSIYGDRKDVPLMLAFGQAGITYCLREAKRLQTADRKTAEALKGMAKTIAYNLGSNTWPGWNDEGVVITSSDLAIGLDAALLNLRLGRELQRNHEVMGNAHWLVGAQQLAAGKLEIAVAAFEAAKAEFSKSGKSDYVLMTAGYAGLARKWAASTRTDGETQLKEALADLEKSATEDAKFFAEQLRTAERVLKHD